MATTLFDDEVFASINYAYEEAPAAPIDPDSTPSRWHRFCGYVLFFLMGLSPQLLQNGLFMETSVFRNELPEGSAISAAIVTSFMAANVFVLLYLIAHSIRPISDRLMAWVIFLLCGLVGVLVAFLWNQTVTIGGEQWSYVLLFLAFIAGLAGNTSTLVFFAFASNYLPILTSALSAGYGASSGVAAAVTLLEHAIDGFNVMAYFLVLEAGIVAGLVAYLLVNKTRLGRSLKTYHYESGSDDEADFFSVTSNARDYTGVILEDGDSVLNPNPVPEPGPSAGNKPSTGVAAPLTNAELLRRSAFPLLNMMWISAITFFMPGLIPYITKDKFKTTFLNGIFLIAPPLGASISGFLPFYKISITNVALTAVFVYILLPCLDVLNGVVPTDIWALYVLMSIFALLSGYNTTMVYLLAREKVEPQHIDKVSRWIAMANQLGATLGTVATDVVIAVHLLRPSSL